jgi:acyl-coenzyme A synthetase/AMP-(fatty) acid ligase
LASSNEGLTVRLVGTHGQPTACGETGEILLAGSGLFKEYWDASAEAMAEIRNSGFRTGDMGLTDEQGDVQLMGRMDDILKVCGHKINLREVESVLQGHPSEAEAVVVALVDQRTNMEAMHAFVVHRKGRGAC